MAEVSSFAERRAGDARIVEMLRTRLIANLTMPCILIDAAREQGFDVTIEFGRDDAGNTMAAPHIAKARAP